MIALQNEESTFPLSSCAHNNDNVEVNVKCIHILCIICYILRNNSGTYGKENPVTLLRLRLVK